MTNEAYQRATEIREQAKRVMKSFQARMSEQYGLIELHDHPITFYFEKYDKRTTDLQSRS